MIKKLVGDTAVYGLSSIVGRMMNYLLVPFYTTKGILAPEEYGAVGELMTYVAFLNIVYTYGMETAYFRFATREGNQTIFNQAVTAILISSILFSGLLVLFASPIVELLQYPGKEIYVYLLAGILAVDAVIAIPFAQLRLQGKAGQFALAKIFNILINIAFNLILLKICNDVASGKYLQHFKAYLSFYDPQSKVTYVFLANFIASATLLLILWRSFTKFSFHWDTPLFKKMFTYAYPLIFMGIAGHVNQMADRLFIKYYLPENLHGHSNQYLLGVYNACAKFSVFMILINQAFRYAAEPFYFAQAQNKKAPELFAKIMNGFVLIGCCIFILVSINVGWLKHLLIRNPAYHIGIDIVPYLLLAYLFLGIYYNLSVWFKLTDRTHFGTYVALAGAGITLVSNLILLPLMGYKGAAVATLITYFLMTVISYFWGQKYYPIPYSTGKLSLYILVSILIVGLFHWI